VDLSPAGLWRDSRALLPQGNDQAAAAAAVLHFGGGEVARSWSEHSNPSKQKISCCNNFVANRFCGSYDAAQRGRFDGGQLFDDNNVGAAAYCDRWMQSRSREARRDLDEWCCNDASQRSNSIVL
jgi:hypothetical protein